MLVLPIDMLPSELRDMRLGNGPLLGSVFSVLC